MSDLQSWRCMYEFAVLISPLPHSCVLVGLMLTSLDSIEQLGEHEVSVFRRDELA